jgi:hypothetical protein
LAVNSCPNPFSLCTGTTEGGHLGPPPSFSQVKAAREFAATEGGHLGPSPPFSLSKAAREFTEFTEDLSVSFSSVRKSRGPKGTSPAPPLQ